MTSRRFAIALFFLTSSFFIWFAHAAQSSNAARYEVFHLKKGAHFVYDFKGMLYQWSFSQHSSVVDSGEVSYTIGDSLVMNDTTVVWSVTQTLDLRRRWGTQDSTFPLRRSSVLLLHESTTGNHELRDTALMWEAPVSSRRMFRYSDSSVVVSYIHFGGPCMVVPANFDSLRCSSDSSLIRRSYSTCDDHDEWGSLLWRRGRLLSYQMLSVNPSDLPKKISLHQNYPNPFNPSTEIRYQIPSAGYVSLKVFDLLGQEVATLVDEVQEAGFKSVTLSAAGLSSGVYFYRLAAGSFCQTKKLMVMR